jgi:excisionase family DNA binding protein
MSKEKLMNRTSPEPLWTPSEVAAYLGVPVQTLYQWRRKRTGPPGRRVGRHLRYDPDAVRAWFKSLSDDAA